MAGQRTLYVESSALIRVLVEGDAELAVTIDRAKVHVSSTLTILECHRAIARAVSAMRLSPAAGDLARSKLKCFEEYGWLIPIDGEVLAEARAVFPLEPVRSLDAIHLASMVIWARESGTLAVASCDQRVRDNALALGLPVLPD